MKIINVYVVHTPTLTQRNQYMNTTIDILKKLTDSLGFKTNIHMITEPAKIGRAHV